MTVQYVTANEITSKVLKKEKLFILDVRNREAFNDWKIEGEMITHLNVPYFELLDGIDSIQNKLPTNDNIIVVCAKEGASILIAEMIKDAGFNATYLKGGMKSWSEHLEEVKVYEDDDIEVYQFIRVGKGCLSYMVISDGEALVVDPARFTNQYVEVAERLNANITHIVDSHLHADHISGGKELAEKVNGKYYLMKSEGAIFNFEHLENYESIEFSKVSVEILAVKTPGHTPGSVSFFVNNKLLFSGDTIFISGLGRPDLGNKVKEWAEDLYDTVYSKVSEIADDVIVLPSHYADLDKEINNNGYIGDTLGNIRKRNEKMFTSTKEEFLHEVEKSASSIKPPNFEKIVLINRGQKEVTPEIMQELEIGPNRCAVYHTK